jgi:sugar lactone lactonase YvrE
MRVTASLSILVAAAACAGDRPTLSPAVPVAAVGGFDGPEGVRYDAEQDVFFVGNLTGDSDSLDNSGFISRVRPDGTIEQLRFIAGGVGGVTLHAPRGMVIHGDTLWAVDADALRGFDRRSGAPLAVVDLRALDPGFPNDVTVGGDGALYLTDTGRRRIHRVTNGRAEQIIESRALGGPNGITWDQLGGRFLVASYFEGKDLLAWQPGGAPRALARGTGGGYDGVEIIGLDSVLVASQNDSSLQLFTAGAGRPWLKLRGEPADIGVNLARRIVAVPFVGRDTVEFFRLP